jgi:N-acetylglucosaminyldiphosphoundecaprenol N-acetyl-beta-D-mannosaminyltransferase
MGRLQGHRDIRRVYGPDLLLNICEHSQSRGFTHFLYGGTEGAAGDLARALQQRFPRLKIVGTYTPPFRPLTPEEVADLQRRVSAARPDFFWVGLGMPKQEQFIAEFLPLLPEANILLGVGAAFDFHTGRVRQAPRWMMRIGLEWLFRLSQDPRRLWRRYVVYNPLFIVRALAQLSGWKRYSNLDALAH